MNVNLVQFIPKTNIFMDITTLRFTNIHKKPRKMCL